MLRTVLAVVVGIAAAVVMLIGVEGFSAVVHPFPDGFGNTQEEMCAHVAKYPPWVLAVVIPMWGGIGFVSPWVAGRIGNVFAGVFVGVLFLAAVVVNVVMLPYPVWFKVGMPIVAFLAIALAVRLRLRAGVAGQEKVRGLS